MPYFFAWSVLNRRYASWILQPFNNKNTKQKEGYYFYSGKSRSMFSALDTQYYI